MPTRSVPPAGWPLQRPTRATTYAEARSTSGTSWTCSCNAAWQRPRRSPQRPRPVRPEEASVQITVTVNGTEHTADVEPRILLADFIRRELSLTGTHMGCDTTSCGVCTVLLDGKPVKACTLFAVQANGRQLTTVEGLKQDGALSSVQQGFKQEHGLQCGFCTPAMMLVGTALLETNPDPSEDEIRWAISGNLCRCTGYMNIVKAIRGAASERNVSEPVPEQRVVSVAEPQEVAAT